MNDKRSMTWTKAFTVFYSFFLLVDSSCLEKEETKKKSKVPVCYTMSICFFPVLFCL